MTTILITGNQDGSGRLGQVSCHPFYRGNSFIGQEGWFKTHANHFYPGKHYGPGRLVKVSDNHFDPGKPV